MDKTTFRKMTADWLDAHKEDIAALLQDFCSIPSVSRADLAQPGAPFGPDCRRMLDHALEKAREMGFETEDYDGYCGSAALGDGSHAIAVIAHLDVVPEGTDWRWPPYSAHREGDYIYGRGTSDNKSAAVATLFLMKMFRELAIPMKHGIKLFFGCSEETGMQDVMYYREHYPLPAFLLVPDGAFPVNYAQKGSMNLTLSRPLGDGIARFEGGEVPNAVPARACALLRAKGVRIDKEDVTWEDAPDGTAVRATGLAAHAARPENGKNAFVTLANALKEAVEGESRKAMEELELLASDLSAEKLGFACEDPDTGKTTVNIGVAKTENGRLSVTLDSRVSIGMKPEEALEKMRAFASAHGWEIDSARTSDAMYIPKDDPKVQCLQALYKDMTGDDAQPYAMGGGTYARMFPNALTFGPGGSPIDKDTRPGWLTPGHGGAHAPDEYCYLPSLLELGRIYASALVELDPIVP